MPDRPFSFDIDPTPEPNIGTEVRYLDQLSTLFRGTVTLSARVRYEDGNVISFYLLPQDLGLVCTSTTKIPTALVVANHEDVPRVAKERVDFRKGREHFDDPPSVDSVRFRPLEKLDAVLGDAVNMKWGATIRVADELKAVKIAHPSQESSGPVMRRMLVGTFGPAAVEVVWEGPLVAASRVKYGPTR